jgi:predicted deacylase
MSRLLQNFSILLLFCFSCSEKIVSESYDPEGSTDTKSKHVDYQIRRTWRLDNGNLSVSNEFTSARLNDFKKVNDTLYTAVIHPENAPINKSPWYAFKIWAKEERNISIQMEYSEGYAHRYYPDISKDLVQWSAMDSSRVSEDTLRNQTTIKLTVGPEPLYIAGQEIMTSEYVYDYTEELSEQSFVSGDVLGYSTLGKPIPVLEIGNRDSRKVVVVLGRQHPPEATGFLALQAFINELTGSSSVAQTFRDQYLTILVPMINPDGVDQGHWRHNAGGIDLNRDWYGFNQPETAAVRDYFTERFKNKKIIFAIDFHSTQEDLFYVFDKEKPTAMTGFTHQWLDSIEADLGDYKADRIPTSGNSPVSTRWFFETFNAEAVTYEVGDDSPRSRIKAIGESAAEALMKILTEQN